MKDFYLVWQACINAILATSSAAEKGKISLDKCLFSFINLKKLIANFNWATLILACAISVAQGQGLPGTNDVTFNTADVTLAEGFNNTVWSMALQPDGKIIAGGDFTTYNVTSRNRIVRLTTDGSLDESFNPGTGFNAVVQTLALQPDGKMVIGGNFTSFNGTSRTRIARLNADGSLDESFMPGAGFNNTVISIKLQPDGKIIVGGNFTSFNGTSRNRIVRLNTDGSLDESFNSGTGFNAVVQTLALQPDGKLVLGGSFTSYNGTSLQLIARLNADGTLDDSFNSESGFGVIINTIALQPDGKIVVTGIVSSKYGEAGNRLTRLNADGSPDNSFNSLTRYGGIIYNIAVALQPDGKIIVGEAFDQSGASFTYVSRLNANGSKDNTFNPGYGFSSTVKTIVLQPDGKIIAGGSFTSYNGVYSKSIARLHGNGSRDISYNPGTGFNDTAWSIALQPDGKMVVVGGFTFYNGTSRNRITRLHTNGSLDESFNSGVGFNDFVRSIALQPDGKMLAGGIFTAYNGTFRKLIARLNTDGSLDESFNPDMGLNPVTGIASIVLQPDGKIIAGGNFSFYTIPLYNIARFHADGSRDSSFDPGRGFNAPVYTVALQPDGKMVIGGDFTFYNGTSSTNGTSCNRIARLNADGSLDNSFNSGTGFGSGFNRTVNTITLQPDGKMVIGGDFTSYSGTVCNRIVRLNTNGTLDNSFNPGTGFNDPVLSILLQPDGKVVATGAFSYYNNTSRNRIAILNADGSLYNPFNPKNGFEYAVTSTALQPDGKIVVVGSFPTFDGIIRNRIARLHGGEGTSLSAGKEIQAEPKILAYPNPTSGDLYLAFANFEANARTIEVVLYNNIGQPVLQQVVNPEQVQTGLKLRTANFAAGVYYLRVRGEGKTTSKQIVLQR